MKSVAHRDAFPAKFVFAGRHRFARHEEIVQPSDAGETRLTGNVEETFRIPKERLGVFFRDMLEKPFRAGAGPSLEQRLEMKRAQVDVRGNFLKGRAAKLVGVQETESAFDPRVIHRRL